MTYQDWLKLNDEQRDEIHFRQWNVYERDGYIITHMAASRLAEGSHLKIFDIRIGTYHGDEYTLDPYVSDIDYQNCPPMLQQVFEGFRVIWHPLSQIFPDPPIIEESSP